MDSPQGWDNTAKEYGFFQKLTNKFALHSIENVIGKEPPKEKINVLDVACGTGALALSAANYHKENIHVLATDFSPKMIQVISENIEKEGLKNVEAKVMDGQALDLPNESFHYVFSLFGVIFFPGDIANTFSSYFGLDRLKGMKEFHRVLKKGGKVAITGWSDIPIPKIFARGLKIAQLQPKPSSGPNFTNSLADTKKFADELTEAGFKDVEVTLVTFPFKLESAKHMIEMFKTNPAVVSLTEGFSNEEKTRFYASIEQAIIELYPDGNINLDFTATLGVGTK